MSEPRAGTASASPPPDPVADGPEVPGPRREPDADGTSADAEPALRLREVAAAERSAEAEFSGARAQRAAARSQGWATWIQFAATIVAAAVAVFATYQGLQGIAIARGAAAQQVRGDERESREGRLATALASLDAENPAARVGALTLLQRSVEERIAVARAPDATEQDRRDAVLLYASALDIVENILRNQAVVAPGAAVVAGQSEVVPPPEVGYVIARFARLLELAPAVSELGRDVGLAPTSVSLANAVLYRSNWSGVRFSLLPPASGRFLVRADLRGALFAGSDWTRAVLDDAYLQCVSVPSDVPEKVSFRDARLQRADLRGADLSGADLSRADLRGADLRGANVQGSLMAGARLDGARLEGSYGSPTDRADLGPGRVGTYTIDRCLERPEFRREPAAPAPLPPLDGPPQARPAPTSTGGP